MYKINAIADLLQIQKEQCSCFGPAPQGDQHFLAKQKTTSSTSHITIEDNFYQAVDQSFKGKPKKSLKRQPPAQATPHDHISSQCLIQEESRYHVDFATQKWRIEHQVVPYPQGGIQKGKTLTERHQFKGKNTVLIQNNAIHQFQNRVAINSTPIMAPQINPYQNTPLRVLFGKGFNNITSFPQILSLNRLQLPQEQNEHISQNLNKSTQRQKGNYKTKVIQKFQSLQNITMHNQDEEDCLDFQNLSKKEQKHLTSQKLQVSNIKISQSPQKTASRSSLNVEIGKSQHLNLKKMDDVIEICSQAGSDQCDSSDQSIVVGRLNEYCSMVQVKAGSTIAEKSVQSKGAGLTSISSTISHYHLNRKKGQI